MRATPARGLLLQDILQSATKDDACCKIISGRQDAEERTCAQVSRAALKQQPVEIIRAQASDFSVDLQLALQTHKSLSEKTAVCYQDYAI